jgi:two-component system CheB/CheR fusion protein
MPRVVGIGASAGGLIALEQFLSGVPEASGLAYIVIQHLDPTHPALLCELLQRVTSMRVCEAGHSMRLQADQVYVIPPNSELTVKDYTIQVTRPSQRRGMRLPIDALFQSLAQMHADRAIGVVLSGMGADGTKGLLAIKQQRGLTLAQTPSSAQFDSMPASAIAAGCVDIVAEPQLLAERICRRLSQTSDGGLPESASASALVSAGPLQAIIAMLRERSKRDLSLYKTSTLLRRIERRMSVRGLDTMRGYEEFLRDNPAELDLMFREVLIGVTAFFRDPEVWQQLCDVVVPQLLAQHADGSPVRAWVVGCSTGEEAYSLAMIFLEAIAAQAGGVTPTVRIFASDLSAEAIEFARKGRYPATIGASVGAERLSRFFRAEGGDFVVKKPVREMVLFAHHDVILDPPFTRLDLLSCRNLLIYYKPALQRRLIPLFRYCLRPGGTLLLGESETIGASQSLFTALAAKARIYRCSGVNIEPGAVTFPVKFRSTSRRNAQEILVSKPTTHNANVQALVDQIILQQFSPAAVLVNQRGDILYINGRTGRYLEPAAGKADWNIHAMARPGIRTRLAEALRAVAEEGKAVELRGLKVEDASGPPVDVTVQAIHDVDGLSGKVLIVFRDIAGSPATAGRSRARATKVDPALGEELQRSRDEIRALRHETRASKEELQAANEELQSTNEELQSANEELTTSKEEAQSMNEELQTLNNELRTKLDDLALAQSDMQNLLNSTHIATLFLDNDLNVRRFTEQATQIVHLRDVDIGRPLRELSSTLSFPELESNARETLKTLATSEKEVATTDGQWYCVRIMPYRTGANVIQGVVITFVNITAAKKLESRLRGA